MMRSSYAASAGGRDLDGKVLAELAGPEEQGVAGSFLHVGHCSDHHVVVAHNNFRGDDAVDVGGGAVQVRGAEGARGAGQAFELLRSLAGQ